MTEQDYLLAWAMYGTAALAALLVGFRMTAWMWRALREPLRVVMAVLLFTPTLVDPLRDLHAPAIAITALDLLFKTGSNVWHAVSDLATVGLVAFALYLLFVAVRWGVQRQLGARRPVESAEREPTLSELLEQPAGESRR